MAKQIYIDSDGNEIQVSGTVETAGNLPLGSDFSDTDSTGYAVHKLQEDLPTFTNSTLTGKTNITVNRSQVYKYGKLCFVSAVFTPSANISTATDILTTPSGYNAGMLTDMMLCDNSNNAKPCYIQNNTITANAPLISGTPYFMNGVYRTV